MPISAEQAKQDVGRVLTTFGTVGEGSEQDRAAQLVLQSIDVLRRDLKNTGVLELLYINNPEASKFLPETVLTTATALVRGETTMDKAEQVLDEARAAYVQAFEQMGISPAISRTLRF